MHKFTSPILVFLFCILCCCSKGQQNSIKIKADSIFKKYTKSNMPGYAVAIIQHDTVVFKKYYGAADLENEIPVTASTVFNIASVSKQFTGLAISMLAEQGKIILDEDVHTYIPELPAYEKQVTIRHLLHHSSGIKDCYEAMTTAGWRWDDVFAYDDILRITTKLKKLNFEPGTRYAYSNTEYVLLQEIVQRITKQSFNDWTRQNIFDPIGMKHSYFVTDYTTINKNPAQHYQLSDSGFVKDPQQLSSRPMFSTLDDLIKWTNHFNQRLAAADPVYTRMTTDFTLSTGKTAHYGFGLLLGNDLGIPTIMHTGAWGGYRAVIRNYPSEKLSVIILGNAGDNDLNYGYSFQLAKIFLGEKFRKETVPEPVLRSQPAVSQKTEPVVITAAKLQQYTGIYINEDLVAAYAVKLVKDKLVLSHVRRGDFELRPKPAVADEFLSDIGAVRFLVNEGKIEGMEISNIRFYKKD
jgi:CubicO group peptidase (beta-lactamase class C family)